MSDPTLKLDRIRFRQQLTLHEGRRLFPYPDSMGKLTIGVGHNLTDNGISEPVCDLLLEEDIDRHVRGLADAWPPFFALDEVRARVVADMAFNLGVHGLLEFKRTLTAIEEQRYDDAARYMLESKWAKQVGIRARRLSRMMATGRDYKLVGT